MNQNIQKMISLGVSVFLLVIGLTTFFSLFEPLLKHSINTAKIYPADKSYHKTYKREDIYFVYKSIKNNKNTELYGVTTENDKDLYIDEVAIDFSISDEENTEYIFSLGDKSYEKTYEETMNQIVAIKFNSR